MTTSATLEIIDRLAVARGNGGVVSAPPRMTLAEGYAVAEVLYGRLGKPAGWKVGATSIGAQTFLEVDEPIRGRLFAERIWREGDVAITGDRVVEAEPEVVLHVGLDGRPDAAWLGVELNRSSFADPFAHGAGAIVADNAASVGVLIGPSLPLAALDEPASLTASIRADGKEVACGGADAVLGDPRRAYDWLQAQVALLPGDIVATGAMGRSAVVARGARLTLDGGRYGSASFTLK